MSALPPGYAITDDPARIDAAAAHAYLTRSYWAAGIPLETVARSIANSFTIAVLHEGEQVAMARLVTDFATMAYLADVYVLEEHRGQGLSHAMLDWLHEHPRLQGLRRWILFTQDAQDLYAQHEWKPYPYPERLMTRDKPDIYA